MHELDLLLLLKLAWPSHEIAISVAGEGTTRLHKQLRALHLWKELSHDIASTSHLWLAQNNGQGDG